MCFTAPVGIRVLGLHVHQRGGVHRQAQRAFGVGLLLQQHAPHVGVFDDRHRRRRRVLLVGVAALLSFLGVLQRVAVAGRAQHDRAQAHADARLVHHVEHLRQALVRLAHEFSETLAALAELQEGVDDAALAQLVVHAGQLYVVALAQAAVVVHADLGHDEQADALHARRRVRQAGEHEVDDVVGQVVFAAADPHLGAAEAVAAVARGFGARADVAQRRAGLRLAQAHRAQEAALQDRRAVARALLRRAVRLQQVGHAARQHRVAGGGHVGRHEHGVASQAHRVGQLHATLAGIGQHGGEAGFGEGIQRHLHLRDDFDAAVGEAWLVFVRGAVVAREGGAGQVLRGVEHGVEGFARMIGEARVAAQRAGVLHFVQQEVEVAAVHGAAVGHGGPGRRGSAKGSKAARTRRQSRPVMRACARDCSAASALGMLAAASTRITWRSCSGCRPLSSSCAQVT